MKFLEEYKAANPDREVTIERIDSGTDLAIVADRVGAYLNAHPDTTAYFDTGFWHAGVARVLHDRGVAPGKVLLGGFDLVPEVLQQMKAGYVQVQIDQQPYDAGLHAGDGGLSGQEGRPRAGRHRHRPGRRHAGPGRLDHGARHPGRALDDRDRRARAGEPRAAGRTFARAERSLDETPAQDLSGKAGAGGLLPAGPARRPFQVRSDGVFLSRDNLRGVLGLLPEVGLVAIGVTHPDDLRRVRPFGRLGVRADADGDGASC